MSQVDSTVSKFFSLPYDREGYGSLERLIGREWEALERDEASRNHARSHDSTLWDRTSDVDVDGSHGDVRRQNFKNLLHSRGGSERRSHSSDPRNAVLNIPQNLIDLDNNEFISCDNLDARSGDFIDFNNRNNIVSSDSNLNNFVGSYNNAMGSGERGLVEVRNRRNCSSPLGAAEDVNTQCCITTSCCCSQHQLASSDANTPPHHCFDRSVCGGNGYGSLPGGDDMSGIDNTLTYCVHGKPGAGCCATLLNQPTAPTINISIDEHCHIKERDTGVNKKARRQIIVVSSLCLFFMIAEAIGGYLSSSLAIATDAAHLLTDFAGFMISLFALYVAGRKPSRIMPFGWHRAEVIGAMVSVLTIWLVTGILVYLAVQRIIDQNFEIDATVMLITSAIGVVVNIIMALTLHQHSHTHACAHSSAPQPTTVIGPEQRPADKQNINVRAAFIHIIGDLLQSVGVFIAATIIYYKPEYVIVDPICTFLFSVLVLATTFSIMKDALLVLMEGIPRDVDFNDVLSTLLAIDGVIRVHNLRIWALSLDKTALSAHLAIAPSADCTEILKAASKEIHKKYNFFEMTLQIEYFHQNMETCAQCQVPS